MLYLKDKQGVAFGSALPIQWEAGRSGEGLQLEIDPLVLNGLA